MLISAGIKNEAADQLAKEILTRTEAKDTLSTKDDIHHLRQEMTDEINRNTRWMVGVFVGIALGQTAVILGVVSFMLSIYGA